MRRRVELDQDGSESAAAPQRSVRYSLRRAHSYSVLALASLATIAALYFGKEVILPIVFALIFKLLLQPIVDVIFGRLRVPKVLVSAVLVFGVLATIGFVAFAASGPAGGWANKIPAVVPAVKEKLVVLKQPIEFLQKTFSEIEEASAPASAGGTMPVSIKQPSPLANKFAAAALFTTTSFLTTIVILFFLLAAGDRLLRGFIEVLPNFRDKRQAIEISHEIQRQIGGYLLMITAMNALVGVVTGAIMWSMGLGDPIFWGSIAFLLNYVPVLGPLIGILVFFLAGLVSLDWPFHALMPAVAYVSVHILEGEMVTPLLLAKRMTLNPVVVIISLFFWHALWGVPGALLAVPLLATIKIVCDRIGPLQPIGHVIGS